MIEVIFSSQDEDKAIRNLLGNDPQAFVDVMYEARSTPALHGLKLTRSIDQALDRPDLSPRTRENCLKSLHRMCGRHAVLPTTLKIPISFERTGNALYRGGFADVWKGKHCERDVAIKVIRVYSGGDLQKVIGVGCVGRALSLHARELTAP